MYAKNQASGDTGAPGLETLPAGVRDQVAAAIRQRIGRHEHLGAVADALQGVPRSSPFDDLEELAGLTMPAIVPPTPWGFDPVSTTGPCGMHATALITVTSTATTIVAGPIRSATSKLPSL